MSFAKKILRLPWNVQLNQNDHQLGMVTSPALVKNINEALFS